MLEANDIHRFAFHRLPQTCIYNTEMTRENELPHGKGSIGSLVVTVVLGQTAIPRDPRNLKSKLPLRLLFAPLVWQID